MESFGPGTMVTPNVRLVRQLGRGGMGSVWVADHLGLDTQVAVKFISAELAKDEQMRERFSREAKATVQIKSPHVVQTLDHGFMPDGTPYIVMELLHGSSLADHLELEGRLELDEVVEVVRQVASVLERAHAEGIVHRDIKPANVFLVGSEDETFVKVLDFGIAKRTERRTGEALTGTGVMVGTPEYMSPEQVLSARDVDHRADLWALAVMAYEALSGVRPFDGETVGALCVSIARAQFLPPSHVVAGLPVELDAWFARAFDRSRGARFQSATDLAMALERAARPAASRSEAQSGEVSVADLPLAAGVNGAAGVIGPGLRSGGRQERGGNGSPDPAPSIGPGLSGARSPAARFAPDGAAGTAWVDDPTVDATDEWSGERPIATADRSAGLPRRQRSSVREEASPPGPSETSARADGLPPPSPGVRPVPTERSPGIRADAGSFGATLAAPHLEAVRPTRRGVRDAGLEAEPRGRVRAAPAPVGVWRGAERERPSLAAIGGAALVVAATMLSATFLEPAGVASLQRVFGQLVYVAYGVAAVVLLLGAKLLGDAGFRTGSLLLALSTLGLLVLAACLGVTAVGLTGPSVDVSPLRAALLMAAPLSAASVAVGLALFALLRAREDLFGTERRVPVGVLLAVLAAASLGAAARVVGRSPLFRHDDVAVPPPTTSPPAGDDTPT